MTNLKKKLQLYLNLKIKSSITFKKAIHYKKK